MNTLTLAGRFYSVLLLAVALAGGAFGQEPQSVLKPSPELQPKTGYVQREDLAELAHQHAAANDTEARLPVRLEIPVRLMGLLAPCGLLAAAIFCSTLLYVWFLRWKWNAESAEIKQMVRRTPLKVSTPAIVALMLFAGTQALALETGYVPREDLVETVAMREKMSSWRPDVRGSLPSKYRCQKYLGPVRSQGNCGSCWNFSGTTAVEGALAKAGILPPGEYLSPQYSMDCWRNGGCNGDDPSRVAEVAMKTGLPTEADYGDYRARAGRCKGGQVTKFKISDWGFCDGGGLASTESIKSAMIEHGPISVCVAADGAFSAYRKGTVFRGSSRRVNHAVVLVGWDDSVGREGAWLLRNSWGEDWGDGGHMWIEYGANRVGTAAFWCRAESGRPVVSRLWAWVRGFFFAFLILLTLAGAGAGGFFLGRRIARLAA